MKIETTVIGQSPSGQDVTEYALINDRGHRVSVMNVGATLLDVVVPDREGKLANVNLRFDSLQPYLSKHPYFGSTVGRFCNRIGNARFVIDGTTFKLTRNHGEHMLHGGTDNFAFRYWDAELREHSDSVSVQFSLTSPDGDEGFPGTLHATSTYAWNEHDELTMDYSATTDTPTHVNLCNHSYWNLSGAGSGSAMATIAKIEADRFLDVDPDLIPTGKLNPVAATPLDFRTPRALGDRLAELPSTGGYDHCYAIRGNVGTLRDAAEMVDPSSGRTLTVRTTQPGMQLYTANHLPGDEGSAGYGGHEAFCVETQGFPDAPNRPEFPSTLLRPGQAFKASTLHRFSTVG